VERRIQASSGDGIHLHLVGGCTTNNLLGGIMEGEERLRGKKQRTLEPLKLVLLVCTEAVSGGAQRGNYPSQQRG